MPGRGRGAWPSQGKAGPDPALAGLGGQEEGGGWTAFTLARGMTTGIHVPRPASAEWRSTVRRPSRSVCGLRGFRPVAVPFPGHSTGTKWPSVVAVWARWLTALWSDHSRSLSRPAPGKRSGHCRTCPWPTPETGPLSPGVPEEPASLDRLRGRMPCRTSSASRRRRPTGPGDRGVDEVWPAHRGVGDSTSFILGHHRVGQPRRRND